jgi:hypothetical protein
MKIVINACHGGFGLSDEALERYNALTGKSVEYYFDVTRADPALVQIVEEMGSKAAGGKYSELKIVEVPDGIKWHISEYGGMEHVAENHQTWY